MASRRDVPRTSRPDTKQPGESAPTVYPASSDAKRRAAPPSRPASAKGERATPPREAPTPDAMAQGTGVPSAASVSMTRGAAVEVSREVRYRMICEAAFLRAERRGFTPGGEVEDWLAAEEEVDRLLSAEHVSTPQ
jgi:Protein of unknown function (DUF2934)